MIKKHTKSKIFHILLDCETSAQKQIKPPTLHLKSYVTSYIGKKLKSLLTA